MDKLMNRLNIDGLSDINISSGDIVISIVMIVMLIALLLWIYKNGSNTNSE